MAEEPDAPSAPEPEATPEDRATERKVRNRRKTNDVFVKWYKISRGCTDCWNMRLPDMCGSNRHVLFQYAEVLEFDHLSADTKVANVSDLVHKHGASPEVIWDEIQKCDVVCCVCHRLRSITRKQ